MARKFSLNKAKSSKGFRYSKAWAYVSNSLQFVSIELGAGEELLHPFVIILVGVLSVSDLGEFERELLP